MIDAIIAWFLKYPTKAVGGIALVVFVAALIGLSGYLKIELTAKERSFDILQNSVDARDIRIGTLTQQVAADEEAFSRYKQLAKIASDEAAAGVVRAQAVAKASSAALANMRATKVPNDCQGAHDWAKSLAPDLAEGWTK
jgi:hypothetical protein